MVDLGYRVYFFFRVFGRKFDRYSGSSSFIQVVATRSTWAGWGGWRGALLSLDGVGFDTFYSCFDVILGFCLLSSLWPAGLWSVLRVAFMAAGPYSASLERKEDFLLLFSSRSWLM